MVDKKNNVSHVASKAMETGNTNNSDLQRTMLKSAAGVVGSGILLGSLTTLLDHGTATPVSADLMAQATSDSDLDANNFGWSDGDVPVSDLNTDHMSFGEAFSAARADLGVGGAFVWRGQVFTTFTTEEWNELPLEEQSDFENHFELGGDTHATPVIVDGDELKNALNDELIADLQDQVDVFSADLSDGFAETSAQMEGENADLFANYTPDLDIPSGEPVEEDVLMAAADQVQTEEVVVEEQPLDEMLASVDVEEVVEQTQQVDQEAGGVNYEDIQLDAAMDAVSQMADDELVASVDHIQDAVDDVQTAVDEVEGVHYDDIQFASTMDENSVMSDDELVASVDNMDNVVDDFQETDNNDNLFAENADESATQNVEDDDLLAENAAEPVVENVEEDGELLASVDDIQQEVDDVVATVDDLGLASNPILGEAGADMADVVNDDDIQDLLNDIRGEIDAEDLVNYEYNPEDYVNNGDVDSYDAV